MVGLLCALPSSKKLTQRFIQVRNLKSGGWIRFLYAINYKGSNIYLSVNPLKKEERNERNIVDSVNKLFFDPNLPIGLDITFVAVRKCAF